MKILLVSATKFELEKLFELSSKTKVKNNTFFSLKVANTDFDVLITGIGIYNCVYSLTKILQHKNYDLIINVGIAGSFDNTIELGTIVEVNKEVFADIVNDGANIKTLFEYGLMNNDEIFKNGILENSKVYFNKLDSVKGLTTNSLNHTQEFNIKIYHKFESEIETMEGAAFFYVCLNEKVPFVEIRAISNYVGEQDKSKWDIELALENLYNTILELFNNNLHLKT